MIRRVVMFKRIWKARGLWFRIIFCWALGSAFLFFDEVKQYDLRFAMRGAQEHSPRIVMVQLDDEDLGAWMGTLPNQRGPLRDATAASDIRFWRAQIWNELLGDILAQSPRSVGVTFFFSARLTKPPESLSALRDPRVVWAAQLDSEGLPLLPVMADELGQNVGLVDLREDEDHILRRFGQPEASLPHMSFRLTHAATGGTQSLLIHDHDSRVINFRGGNGVFPTISALNILKGHAPKDFFKDKIVIIGGQAPSLYRTPTGVMSRAGILAHIVDNMLEKRWIKRLSTWGCALYLLIVVILAAAILVNYPQSIAFVFLLWLGLGTTALSIWVFDSFYYWIPAFSPLALALVAYITFISYQLSRKENQTWRLEQEKQLLSELDQLRNNFVSLISHDLKTPIAKMQAICDRLLAGTLSEEVRDGLLSVRKESQELHRYIQSILQISRLESNKIQLHKEATDLNEVVEKVVNQVHPLSADKRQQMDVELEPLFSLEVDGVLIQEVVLNLIENAVKYTPNDGHIEVKTKEVDDKVIFTVQDSGPGIPPGDRQRIFEKFFRGQAEQGLIKGTGLGLYLVKYFIELHGGEVFLESEVGKGTRVGFTLPLEA